MISGKINILLADDDKDDCLFFKEAVEELELCIQLTTVHKGEQLMELLAKKSSDFFDVLFLDLNMPRKNGFTCLKEIKQSEKTKSLPVIIFSTSFDNSITDQLYKNGAQHCICKPSDFCELKKIIQIALALVAHKNIAQPPLESFFLNSMKEILF